MLAISCHLFVLGKQSTDNRPHSMMSWLTSMPTARYEALIISDNLLSSGGNTSGRAAGMQY
jgi:hypothetical protein